ncbi:hypothetical protein [Macrococcoides caseolyticum]|uniref:hypothetical protein n=1 Tax=Macrococcoides caseolyticum TaxID=69966 RepID=UPI001F435E43|nr:hypothetical protein [Macrococcus caseolyticus]MCE4955665.1 hypothetical protein [Macrococcus caseolyticus]
MTSNINSKLFWEKTRNIYYTYLNEYKLSNFPLTTEDIDRLGISQDEFNIMMLGRAIIKLSQNYGVRIELKSLPNAKNIIDKITSIDHQLNNMTYQTFNPIVEIIDQENMTILIKGFLNELILKELDSHTKYKVVKKENNHTYVPDINGDTLINIFKDANHFKYAELTGNHIFYSGVMPRVEQVIINNNKDTPHLDFVKLILGRTTFMTVDVMDNPTVINHPFFNIIFNNRTISTILQDFDSIEDKLQSKYLYSSDDLNNLNHYLTKSYNTHTVAVSGNIITSDNYLLTTVRSSKSIDAETIYMSVNGQSEFYDKNVDFYQDSVYEDIPTMHYDKDLRINFINEVEREAAAELGIINFESDWEMIGLSFLSIDNENKNISDINKRRMHFNINFENKCILNFNEVYERKNMNTESFENEDIYGYKIIVNNNLTEYIKNIIKLFVSFNINHQVFSVPLWTIIFLFIYANSKVKNFNELIPFVKKLIIEDGVTWLVILLLIVMQVFNWILKNQASIFKKKIFIYNVFFRKNTINFLENHHKNFEKYNVILKIMMYLHYERKKV